MKRIRQQHRQTLRVILFRRLFTFKINAGYVRFAQALLDQLAFADAPAPIKSQAASLHTKTDDANPCAASPVRRISLTRSPPTRFSPSLLYCGQQKKQPFEEQ